MTSEVELNNMNQSNFLMDQIANKEFARNANQENFQKESHQNEAANN